MHILSLFRLGPKSNNIFKVLNVLNSFLEHKQIFLERLKIKNSTSLITFLSSFMKYCKH